MDAAAPEVMGPGDPGLAALLALNNEHAAELSLLTRGELERLIGSAFKATRIGEADAFLLAFSEGADYASPNFLWFRARRPRFVYVDRVAVARHARGRGLAKRLYADLFDAAGRAGHALVCCEVNSLPPNPASAGFHAALGFREVGSQSIHGGAKTVRYLEKVLGGT